MAQSQPPSYPSMAASPMAYSNLPEVSVNDAPQVYAHDAPQAYTNDAPEALPHTISPQNIKQEYLPAFYQQQHGATSPYSTSPGPQNSVLYYPPPSDAERAPSHIGPTEEKKKGTVVIKRRTCIILAIVLAIVVVGAIVGGAVGGVMASRNNQAQQGGTGTDGVNGGSGNNGGGGNNGGSGGGGGSNNGTSTPKNPNAILMEESGISAVSYTVDGTDYRMVFWQPQNSSGEIKYSAWDSKNQKWEVVDLKSRLQGSAKIEATPGTAIATAVQPGDSKNGGGSFTLSVVYNGPSGSVQELSTSDVKGSSWEKMTYTIHATNHSQLAARWDVCQNNKCTGTLIVAYENENKQIRLHYPHVEVLDTTKHTDLSKDMTTGSGIALSALTTDNRTNEASSTKVYYQSYDFLKADKSANWLNEITRNIDFSWRDPKIPNTRVTLPLDNPPQTYATSFEKPGMGLLYLAVVQRYPSNGRLTMMHWTDKEWILKEPRSSKAVPGVSLDSRTSAVSISADLKVYVVPDNCESIQIFDVDKEDPGTWDPSGEVTIK
ncbi:hypothetical protein MCOR25_001941 [Pyricularia grisea]|uniref:Fucose-specific lectin n=1 Tax=Pyricularia grisea TaxID=148305 RepID=A0A6P8BH36_PYRGI|nr:uncharacterized protein PgNI_01921 [Pyricularia grisea]KAI6379809.1 hypothetical protein MCOR25_001941 [Pyricularia grisea]TLD16093.1 hypothetical protein PgNI_01921 [Pyricularia grisea]